MVLGFSFFSPSKKVESDNDEAPATPKGSPATLNGTNAKVTLVWIAEGLLEPMAGFIVTVPSPIDNDEMSLLYKMLLPISKTKNGISIIRNLAGLLLQVSFCL